MDDGESSITDTVNRMGIREKTFLTQIDEERADSRQESDFDDSDDEFDYDGSDYDENNDESLSWKIRRKRPAFDIDADFNFDEDDEEDIRRRSKTKKMTTDIVYGKACEKCRLHPCAAFNNQLSKVTVNLCGMHLGPTEIKPIAISLVKDRSIVVLDVSDNNMGPVGVMYLAEMMQANTYLIELNISGTNPGGIGLGALAETLRLNNSIRVLKLEDNFIDHTYANHIANIIKSCPKLQDLHLGHNRLGATGGKVIAQALVSSKGLQTLDLQWNHLRRESAVELSKALAKNKSLRILNVAWNGFAKDGCLALAKSLPVNTCLQELDLTCNRIDFQSLSFFAHGLLLNKGLKTVKLGLNPMTTEGAKALLKSIGKSKNTTLKELSLEDVPVDGEFIDILQGIRKTRNLNVKHGHVMKLATNSMVRDADGHDISKWEPVLVLFEYMRLDNLRLIDMFKSFDAKKRDKLSRNDLKTGVIMLKLPFTEHALDEIMEKLDSKKDGMIDLEEMMKASKEMSRYVNQRILKAKAKKRQDQGLIALRETLKQIIKKRKEEQDQAAQTSSQQRRQSVAVVARKGSVVGVVARKGSVVGATTAGSVGGIVRVAAVKFRRKMTLKEQPEEEDTVTDIVASSTQKSAVSVS